MAIRLTALGSFRVDRDGAEVARLPAQPLRASLLVYLALEREATRERIMGVLWPQRSEGSARHALSQALHDLHGFLGTDVIASSGELLRVAGSLTADAGEFLAAAASGQGERALDLYAGTFLEGWHLADSREFEGWVDRQRARLARMLGETVRSVAAERLRREDLDGAVQAARRWTELEPLDRDAQHFLAETLWHCGRPAEAVQTLRDYLRSLEREDIEPAPETVALLDRLKGDVAMAETTGAHGPRILVLPFTNLGPAENAYFAAGMTDELTTRLGRLPRVSVIARTTAAALAGPPALAEIRRRLQVDYVLAGTVRWNGKGPGPGHVRVTCELFRADSSDCIWTGAKETTFDDVFGAQSRVAEEVAGAIDLRIPSDRTERRRRPAASSVAYDLYLQGRYYSNRRTPDGLREAIARFQAAIEEDPGYAEAYAGLADACILVPTFGFESPRPWYARAIPAAARALELNDQLAEAHAAVGVAALHAWEWPKAERHLRRATELAPSFAPAWVRLAWLLSCTGRPEAAGAAMDRGYALDPLSVGTNFEAGVHGWQLRDRGRALLLLSRTLDVDPTFWPAAGMIGLIQYHGGDLEAARANWARGELGRPLGLDLASLIDRPGEAIALLQHRLESVRRPANWYFMTLLFALFGAHSLALDWLERHYRNVRGPGDPIPTSGPNLAYAATEPIFDPIRTEPRFRELMRKMHLGAGPRTAVPPTLKRPDLTGADVTG